MATVSPSRNPVVAAAFAGLRKSERAEKKKPEPTPAPKKTNAKPPRAKGGKTSKGKS